ncbi:hypothetical protein CYJ73_19890 [Gordonia terrae]|uniref:DUF1772 domain-containing protein n=2 Tax=Gordonia terrae TaxID=2055 RepID=A0A2I1R3W4_9ACTN|nr:hypothetical protein [Gordonia terrae]PKZ63810.1 hypothetical protein CYJ73_19890 [Gordonia terrae]UPW10038.1 hypothetical protein M1C59_04070 [Gordonia terrae]
MDLLRDVLVTLTVVTTGLRAGVLAGFGYAVIPGLTRAGADAAGVVRGDEAVRVWTRFTAVWVPWNIVRSVLTTAAVAVLVVGLAVG